MNFIEEHKKVIVIVVCAILAILMGLVLYRMLVPSDNIYGHRLDEKIEVDSAMIEKIKEELNKRDDVSEVSYKTNVKVMKFFVTTTSDEEKCKEIGTVIIDELSEKLINYYDIEIYFTNDSSTKFPVIGYHSKSSSEFTWVTNKEDTSEE